MEAVNFTANNTPECTIGVHVSSCKCKSVADLPPLRFACFRTHFDRRVVDLPPLHSQAFACSLSGVWSICPLCIRMLSRAF